jgi:hypothetical protein
LEFIQNPDLCVRLLKFSRDNGPEENLGIIISVEFSTEITLMIYERNQNL